MGAATKGAGGSGPGGGWGVSLENLGQPRAAWRRWFRNVCPCLHDASRTPVRGQTEQKVVNLTSELTSSNTLTVDLSEGHHSSRHLMWWRI